MQPMSATSKLQEFDRFAIFEREIEEMMSEEFFMEPSTPVLQTGKFPELQLGGHWNQMPIIMDLDFTMAPQTPLQPLQEKDMFSTILPADSLHMVTGICSAGVKPSKIPSLPRYKCLTRLTGSDMFLRYFRRYIQGHPASFSIGAKYNIEFSDSITKVSLPKDLQSKFILNVTQNVKQRQLQNPFEFQLKLKPNQKVSQFTPCRLLLHHQNGSIYSMNFVLTKKRTYLQKAEFCAKTKLSQLDPKTGCDLIPDPALNPEMYQLAKEILNLKRTNRTRK